MLVLNYLLNKLDGLRGLLMERYELAMLIFGMVIVVGLIAYLSLRVREHANKNKNKIATETGAGVETEAVAPTVDIIAESRNLKPEPVLENISNLEPSDLELDAEGLKKIQEDIAYASMQAVKKPASSIVSDPFANGQWTEAVKRTFKYRTAVNARQINDREKMLQGLVIINIMPPALGGSLGFYGRDILNILNSLGLRFGELGIFHKFNDKGEKIFSISQATEPGIFDMNNMPLCSIKGLSCFFDLGKVSQPKYAFRSLLACVHEIAHYLKAEILDDKMQPLTQIAITEMLKRIKAGEENLEKNIEESLV